MRKLITILLSLIFTLSFGQKTKVYFFPGQGSDERLFSKIDLDTSDFELHYFSYPIPKKKSTLQNFAYLFIDSIDQSNPFVLIGTSLGGMLCSELADTLSPKKTIVISSAKERKELPHRYRFQRIVPLYRVFPKKAILVGAKVMQPIVEPDRNSQKTTFKDMLKRKDPLYMKRSVSMIIRWKKKGYNPSIIHVHGTADHTLPIRKVNADCIIDNGSHMMTLTKGDEINELINELLNEPNF